MTLHRHKILSLAVYCTDIVQKALSKSIYSPLTENIQLSADLLTEIWVNSVIGALPSMSFADPQCMCIKEYNCPFFFLFFFFSLFFPSRWSLCTHLGEMIHIKSFPWSPCYAAGQLMTAKYSESLHSETSSVWYMPCISILFLTGHPLICSLFSFMLKGFSFPIQKLIE